MDNAPSTPTTVATDSGSFQPLALQTHQIGRYALLRRIGEGAMGVVYAAFDERLNRRVALKILRRGQFSGHDNDRKLLREAQALASLSHPNVVQVYEIGEHGGHHYLALEFIQGSTLREWVRARPRSWREIIEVYCQAGRGLAALHAAELVHSDFKPDNAVVGADGRVRLVDLGLASTTVPEDALAGTTGRYEAIYTRVSRRSGTPAYMAPEQHLRAPVLARSDQFSFCVSLWEALHGLRPFEGATQEEIAANVLAHRVVVPQGPHKIPGWLRDALRRGLSLDPERRFASMDALLAAISPSARAARRQPWIMGATVGALALGAVALMRPETPALCSGGQELAATLWGDAARASVREAFMAASEARGELEFVQVDRALSAHLGRWSDAHESACLVHQRGEQSAALFDQRMVCLDQRRLDAAVLVEQFTRADATTVAEAVGAVHALRPIADCEDLERITAGREFRASEAAPEQQERLAALRELLAQAETAEHLGHVAEGLRIAEEAVTLARDLDDRALDAEARRLRGGLLDRLGRYEEASVELLAAYEMAGRVGAEYTQAHALVRWLNVAGYHQDRPDAAVPWIAVARAMVERVDADGVLMGRFHMSVAPIAYSRGRLREALEGYQRALERFEAQPAANPNDVAMALAGLGIIQGQLDDAVAAEATNRRSLELLERHFGSGHPRSYFPLVGMADAMRGQGKLRAALAAYDQALAVQCPEDCEGSHAALGRIRTLIELGELEAAGALLERAQAPETKQYAPEYARELAGTLALRRGDPAAARAVFQSALGGTAAAGRVGLRLGLARALAADGALAAAENEARAALAWLREHDTGAASTAEALTVLGEIQLAAGRPGAAASSLAEAETLLAAKPIDPGRRGALQFALARARAEDPSQRAAALALALRADEALATAESDVGATRSALRAWLDARGPAATVAP